VCRAHTGLRREVLHHEPQALRASKIISLVAWHDQSSTTCSTIGGRVKRSTGGSGSAPPGGHQPRAVEPYKPDRPADFLETAPPTARRGLHSFHARRSEIRREDRPNSPWSPGHYWHRGNRNRGPSYRATWLHGQPQRSPVLRQRRRGLATRTRRTMHREFRSERYSLDILVLGRESRRHSSNPVLQRQRDWGRSPSEARAEALRRRRRTTRSSTILLQSDSGFPRCPVRSIQRHS
jgi:hypothetical protein